MPELTDSKQTQNPDTIKLINLLGNLDGPTRNEGWLTDLCILIKTGENWKIAAANFEKLSKYLEETLCLAETSNFRPSIVAEIVAFLGLKGCAEATEFAAAVSNSPQNKFASAFAQELVRNIADGGCNYFASNYAIFRQAVLRNISDPFMQILLHSSFNVAKSPAIQDDINKFIYGEPDTLKKSHSIISHFMINKDNPLKPKWFRKILALYSDRATLGLTNEEVCGFDGIKSTIGRSLEDPELMRMAFESGNAEIGKIVVDRLDSFRNNPAKEKSEQYARFIQEAYSKALEGDSYHLTLVSFMQERRFDAPAKLLKENFFTKILPNIKNDSSWAYPIMAKNCIAEFDWGFYKKVFSKMNELYEKEQLDELSKIVGILTAEIGAFPAPEVGFLKKIEIAAYLLSSGGITKKLFGSIGAILGLAKGNIPVSRVLNLVGEDEKARTFALMSLSVAVEYTAFSFNLKPEQGQEDGGFVIGELDDAVENTFKKMGKKEKGKLFSMLHDEKMQADLLGNPKTKYGALYLLKLFDYLSEKENAPN